MIVAIDPGHGGSDPGAVGPAGTEEKAHALAIALHLRNIFEKNGHKVILTRETDLDVSYPGASAAEELQARVNIANRAVANIFISIHINAVVNPEAHGVESWYYLSGRNLAEFIQVELSKLGLADRGAKQANFYVLKHTAMPAVLLEIGFISNSTEEQMLANKEFRLRVAQAIFEGVTAWQSI